ncbi:MAG TPA: hypothetical protein VFS11_10220 [Gemmatimonadales bacterium]|nr:hypothetical protein [Gemmatimonadales bacterium]
MTIPRGVLRIPKFDEFQHYKKRNPPWIRLYLKLLDNLDFALLPDATKGQLVNLWMLAARLHRDTKRPPELPADPAWLASKINATEPIAWERLIPRWIECDKETASKMLATCKQNATPETDFSLSLNTDGRSPAAVPAEPAAPPVGGARPDAPVFASPATGPAPSLYNEPTDLAAVQARKDRFRAAHQAATAAAATAAATAAAAQAAGQTRSGLP